ncbi:Uncharacterised protein [Gordonia paraffinivorans]|uniref:Uncharacterized protein n=1 Tax=Gordonia paraffinivorans TaxID=175628 RepID=A0ABD7UZZ5_9ACTN|nr:Uncharacterised protein [Gordonia paraffinivorans]
MRGRFGAKPRKWVLDRRVPATEGPAPGGVRRRVADRWSRAGSARQASALSAFISHTASAEVSEIWLGLAVAGNVTSKVSSFVSPWGR